MPQEMYGALDAHGGRFALVVSRFNEFFTRRMMEGAVDALLRHGAAEKDLTIVWVPGTFELAMAVQRLALSGNHDAVIGLGLVLRGETSHHELLAAEAVKGVARASQASGIPCPLGIVTADSLEQAVERAGGKQGNRGWDAALAAIEMVNLLPALDGRVGGPEKPTVPAERPAAPAARRPARGARRRAR
jgi:6,7-dimethyl-8-ribityllumazine synthase